MLGISARVRALGVDGVDLVQIEGCGRKNLNCDDQTSIHLHVIARLREELPKGMLLSYTFPVSDFGTSLDFPYLDVVNYGLGYLDSISLMGSAPYSSNKTIQSLLQRGVPPSKVKLFCQKARATTVFFITFLPSKINKLEAFYSVSHSKDFWSLTLFCLCILL